MRRLLLLLVVVLVNFPVVHEAWTAHRLASQGEDVRATVVHARSDDGRHLVDYRLPEDVDPKRTVFSAQLDGPAYDVAHETEILMVRVVPGEPGTNRPYGEVESSLLTVAALGADVILLVVAGLGWWRRRKRAQNGPDLYDLA